MHNAPLPRISSSNTGGGTSTGVGMGGQAELSRQAGTVSPPPAVTAYPAILVE